MEPDADRRDCSVGGDKRNVTVTALGVTGTAAIFSVYTGPVVSSFSPASGNAGVSIQGSGFFAAQGRALSPSTEYSYRGVLERPAAGVMVPSGATTGDLVLTVDGISTNAGTFTVVATRTIISLSPNSGAVNSSVTITGTNFGSTQGTSTVNFNGTSATATSGVA